MSCSREEPKLVAVAHVSNSLGTLNDMPADHDEGA